MILKSLFISFFVVIILTQPLSVYSQSTPCTINLSYTVTSPANGVIDCNGAEIELQATGTGQEVGLISNDFNAGLGTGWIATGGSTVGTPCEPSLDNTSYYWASTAGSGTPNLTTVGFDVSCGGIITFDMDYATQGQSSPCEGPDLPNEGVSLEYSTDGGASWIVIDYWDPNGGYDPTLTSWNSYSYPIPIGAQTANTQFQWIQNNSSGSAYDNWGIDNVIINAYSCNTYWYNYTSTSAWVDNSNQIEAITATSTYGVWFTDGISDSCYAEVTVIVPPGPDADAGLNQTICNGSSIIIGADPVTSEDGATYTWDNGAGSGIIDIAGGTNNGQVTVSPTVTTTYELTVEANGCTETDQVVVTVDNPPTASNPAPIVVECASALPAPDINVVTDEADDYTVPPTVTYIGETVDVTGCPETRTRTYRVTDGCGNFIDVFQTITIDPTTNPVVPADAGSTVNCLADAQIQPAAPAVNDQCGNALTPVVSTPADIPCEGTMDWVFTYTDCAGNTADWTYTYTIDIPAFTLPFADAGSTVNCLVDAQVQPVPPAAVNDECGNALTPVVTTPADIPCEGTMDWVFTYTDCAGNTADWTYTYTIDIPAFTVPADGGSTVNCLADAQVQPAAPAVNDQCGNALTPVVSTPADIPCEGTMDWVFTYTDCAGNTADWTYTYTIDIPAFTVPADGGSTVNCLADAQVQPAAPGVNDQCGNTLTPVVTTPADIPCEGTMDWVFTYTDCAGNTADWTYTYTIDIPAFTLPFADAGSTVNCLVDAQIQPNPPATVTDQCGNTLTPVMTTPADIPCEGTMDWVFTYTDCAGNTADWTYTYTIDIPAFTLPFADAGSTVNCLVDAQIQPNPPAAVNDECGNLLTPVVSTPADIPCEGTMDWVFTYTDCAGNTVDWTYTYTIDIPVFTLPANGSESVVCIGDVYVPTPPVMNDGCGNAITPVMSENTDPVCVGDKIYTFTYTDCAGNTADWTYTFSINDNVPPTGTAPADISITNLDPVPPADPTLITDEADNCAAVPTVTHVSDVSDGGSCPEVITRTYQIEDACGNVTLVSHTITIGDAGLPTASDPAPITVECLADVPAPDETVVIDEADDSGVPTVAWEDDTPVGTCPTIIDRRYRVTDLCGNFIFVTQTITVIPSTNPVVPVDGASTVNCLSDAQVQPVAPAVNDVCGNAITPVVTTPADVICEGDMTWVFTYTDCAGNLSVWNYTYTIDLPAFTLPPNDGQTVNCLTDAVVPTPPVMTGICGNTITPVMSENVDPACEGDKIYTFTYTDCAGNTADWVYTYTIDIPAFTLPANGSESVVCIGDIYIPTPPGMTDECGNALAPVMSENADPVCVGDKIYTFTYTDCAGNTADWTYTFSINDNVPPTGTAPADIYLNVSTPIPPADPTLITDEDDNCAAVPTVVHVSDVSDGGTCPEIITRTYEIEDACGNATQVTQLITIGDIVDPTASNPLPVNVECIFEVPAPDITVVTDEADNSGIAPIVAHVGDVSDGQTCPETITRTYSVTDVCGNQITVEQTIAVNDVTAPTATAPATVNVECIGDVPPADINIITDEADNCTAVPVVAHVGDVSDGLSCPETITRTYSITDDCGNVTTIDQLIIVNDITPPTATAPATVNVECIGDAPANISDITDEADNCTVNPVVVHVGDVSDGLSCPETITRTYSITDDCGNSITVDQLIIVNDITPPTASNPAPIAVPGAPLVPAPDPSVVIDELDNCTVTPIVTWVSDVSDGNVCNMEVITRTYSVMDNCGNEIFVTQDITIEAVPPPIDAGPDTLICSDGMATLTADNPWGVPISWDNGITDGMPFSPNGNAIYTVIADNYGCTSTDDVTVTVEQIPTILFTGDQLSGCEPLTVTFTNSSLAESAFDNCFWEFSNGTTLTGCSDVTYTFENGGLYDVTLTTTTVNGCVNSDTYTDYVYVEDIPLAGFIPNSTIISNLNPEINFVNTTADAALGTVYSWTFGDGSPIINSESPTHIFPNENSGSYEVEMIATSPLGCIDTAYGYVRVVEEVIFYVPNTFTPDADNFNEYFQPIFTSGYDPYDFNLFIFNRWGEIIWESHDASVGWDGTYGGNLVQDGTYTWTIEFKTSESDERMYVNGHVNIIK